jgi:uncharacterized membrane protein YvlD (DUF360 family)
MGIFPRHLISAMWRSGVTAAAILAALYLLSPVLASVSHPAARLLLVGMFTFIVWSALLLLLRHPLADELMRAKNVLSACLSRA